MSKTIPLLDLLCRQHPEQSRERLLSFILAGDVHVNGERLREPRRSVPADALVEFVESRYVSRGGDKLEHVLRLWELPVAGRVFVDAGASTGGFTDCLLQHGARYVHTVDVGYNQLAYRLRRDSRVGVHERSNIMTLELPEPQPHAAVADLSFRSAVGAARRVLGMLSEGWMVALVKPQFEIDPGTPGFDGVIRDEELLAETLGEVATRLEAADILTLAAAASPIRGRRGNREFLFLLARPAAAGPEAAEPETAGLPEAGPLDSEGVVRACLSEQAEGRGGGTP